MGRSGLPKLACLYHLSPRSTSMLRGPSHYFFRACPKLFVRPPNRQELILIRLPIFSNGASRARSFRLAESQCILHRRRADWPAPLEASGLPARSALGRPLDKPPGAANEGRLACFRRPLPISSNHRPPRPAPRITCPLRHRNESHGDSHLAKYSASRFRSADDDPVVDRRPGSHRLRLRHL
jgi:hypothetical protein